LSIPEVYVNKIPVKDTLGKCELYNHGAPFNLLPICSHCKNIRDDKGYWNQIESYIHEHSEAEFSHSICPECAIKYYPDMDIYDDNGEVTED